MWTMGSTIYTDMHNVMKICPGTAGIEPMPPAHETGLPTVFVTEDKLKEWEICPTVETKGWSKNNLTQLRLWLNKVGVHHRRIFVYEQNIVE